MAQSIKIKGYQNSKITISVPTVVSPSVKVEGPYNENDELLEEAVLGKAYYYYATLKVCPTDANKVVWAVAYDTEDYQTQYRLFSGKDVIDNRVRISINIGGDSIKEKIKENFRIYAYTGILPKVEDFVEVKVAASLSFSIHQRCFAPWVKFGSIYGASPNAFFGDNRGFSLKDNNENGALVAQSLGKVSSRLYQKTTINYLEENIVGKIGYASETEGKPLFIPNTNATMTEKPYYESSLNEKQLTMRILGQDPLIVPAPNIDFKLSLNFDLQEDILRISGIISYKQFPAYESFIEDTQGNRIFLHTFSPIHEEMLAWELMDLKEMAMSPFNWTDDNTLDSFNEWKLTNPNYDYNQDIEIKIQVENKDGELVFKNIVSALDTFRKPIEKNEVKKDKESSRNLLGNLILSHSFQNNIGINFTEKGRKYRDNVLEDTHKGLNKLKPTYQNRTFENLTINEWNTIHLSRPAADDLDLRE